MLDSLQVARQNPAMPPNELLSIPALKSFPSIRTILKYLGIAAIFCLVIWVTATLAQTGIHYEWQWNRLWRHFGQWTEHGFQSGPLLKGLYLTLGITSLGMIFSVIIGSFAAVLDLSPWTFCRWLARSYIVLWRTTPLLLQLFFAYFLISPLVGLSPFWTAVLALSAFEGAYVAELVRGALYSVPRTQWEASLSLGFNLRQSLFMVILPQACKNALPAFTNQAISLLKDTSLVSAIAVADLTMRAQAIVAETFLAFEVWLIAGGIYLAIALCISLPSLYMEKWRKWR